MIDAYFEKSVSHAFVSNNPSYDGWKYTFHSVDVVKMVKSKLNIVYYLFFYCNT